MTNNEKKRIDNMSQYEMARLWRFAPSNETLFSDDTGEYFKKVFKEKGWFTPEISKRLTFSKNLYE